MRLFIAISLTSEIRQNIDSLLQELRAVAPHAKWIRPDNLHITLKFLGETESAHLAAIRNTLATLTSPQPVSLDFSGLGFFPNEHRARVLWIGMNANSNLDILAADIDRATHALGFPLETRPFTPHLTLARFEPPGLPPQLGEAIRSDAKRKFGSLVAHDFHLIESRLKSSGAEYTTLQSFRFAPGAGI
jgi:2'-5' RNA ligase